MRYGYLEDAWDPRDLHWEPSIWQRLLGAKTWEAPSGPLDVFAQFPPVQDQGAVGDCTCYAVGGAIRYNRINDGLIDVPLSVADLYFRAGVIENNTGDVGRQLRDVMKAAVKGVATDDQWPADKWSVAPPSDLTMIDAAFEYRRVAPRLEDFRISLFLGRPIIVGMDIFKGFEDEYYGTGVVPMPPPLATPIAGHAMLFGRHSDGTLGFQNQWGTMYGVQGRGSTPEGYTKFMRDCWNITMNKSATATV